MAIDYSQSALPKQSREDAELERRVNRAKLRTNEKAQKGLVVERDGAHICRLVPRCQEREKHETAHLDDKGMGGDHGLRTIADRMIRACLFHHRGNWSLHSKDLRVEYLTDRGTDGPIEVWGRDEKGQWFLVGREVAVGQWERD